MSKKLKATKVVKGDIVRLTNTDGFANLELISVKHPDVVLPHMVHNCQVKKVA